MRPAGKRMTTATAVGRSRHPYAKVPCKALFASYFGFNVGRTGDFAHSPMSLYQGGGEFSLRSNRDLKFPASWYQSFFGSCARLAPARSQRSGMHSRGIAARDYQIESKQPRIAP